jgi:hypothetical protein
MKDLTSSMFRVMWLCVSSDKDNLTFSCHFFLELSLTAKLGKQGPGPLRVNVVSSPLLRAFLIIHWDKELSK